VVDTLKQLFAFDSYICMEMYLAFPLNSLLGQLKSLPSDDLSTEMLFNEKSDKLSPIPDEPILVRLRESWDGKLSLDILSR
jgi:hypothetical protein